MSVPRYGYYPAGDGRMDYPSPSVGPDVFCNNKKPNLLGIRASNRVRKILVKVD